VRETLLHGASEKRNLKVAARVLVVEDGCAVVGVFKDQLELVNVAGLL
jgi:hypothetical protein